MARPSNTLERRQQIAAALLKVMAERGYDGASISAIASAAALAPGLIHYHFKNKQEILLEAIQQLADRFRARFEDFSGNATTPEARVRAFIDARLAKGKGAETAAVAAWVVIGAEAVRQMEVKMAYQAALAAQQSLLAELLRDYADAALTEDELQHLTAVLLATMEGIFQLSVSAESLMPQDYAAKTVMEMVASHVAAARMAKSSLPKAYT